MDQSKAIHPPHPVGNEAPPLDLTPKRGLLVHVLRSKGDCTNGGITSRYSEFVLLDDNKELGPFVSRDGLPALRVVRRWIGTSNEYIHAEPLEQPEGLVGPMFGGNFIYTSDSRFPNRYPIPVHDRFETQELYDALSR